MSGARFDAIVIYAQRGWQAFAGLVTLIMIARYLTPSEQGYFYALLGIAALHMAFDMGLSSLLVQFSARHSAGLSWQSDGSLRGASEPFIGLVRYAARWYVLSALAFCSIYPLGVWWVQSGQGDGEIYWKGAWAALVASTALALVFMPVLALNEGTGQVTESYAVRLCQAVLGSCTMWLILATGGGLYAVMVQPLIAGIVCTLWVVWRRRSFIAQVLAKPVIGAHWLGQIWPLQWRTGCSWLAGYALVLMHVPVLMHVQGPIAAGRLGLTMTIVNTLSLLAQSFLTARMPALVRAASSAQWELVDALFKRGLIVSCGAYVAGVGLFIVFLMVIDTSVHAARLLDRSEVSLLILAMGAYHVSGALAAPVRAQMLEPFSGTAVAGAILTTLLAVPAATYWGTTGIVWVLLAVNALYFLPVSIWHWRRAVGGRSLAGQALMR